MIQKTYEVTVDAVVQRTVFVEALSFEEAEKEACKEVKNLVGARSTEVLQITREAEQCVS